MSGRGAPAPAFSIAPDAFLQRQSVTSRSGAAPAGVVEQSTADIWGAVTGAVRDAMRDAFVPPDAVAGLGFAATCSLVALDRDLQPLSFSPTGASERDVIAWMDHRAAEDAARITASGDPVLRYFGGSMSPEMQPPKLAWAQRERPEAFVARRTFPWPHGLAHLPRDRLAHALAMLDHLQIRLSRARKSLARGVFRAGRARRARPGRLRAPWRRDRPAGDAAGLRPRRPRPPPRWASHRERRSAAGLIDAHAGALGTLGARDGEAPPDPTRRLALILGTSSSCMALSSAPRFVDGVWGPHFSALTPGHWLIDGGQSAFGAAIDHVVRLHPAFRIGAADSLARLEAGIVARAGGFSQAARLARRIHVLPSFLGTRGPVADPEALGAIAGLDLGEDEASLQALYVACLCGLAYGIEEIIAALKAEGYDFESIVASGGAARSRLVRQIIADACAMPVAEPVTPEPVLLGSAMIGAAAAGLGSLESLMVSMSQIADRVVPQAGAVAAFHAKKRRAYRALEAAERASRAAMASRWPRLIIFDCDGVLVDSEPIALAVTRRMLASAGIALTDEETRKRFLGAEAGFRP